MESRKLGLHIRKVSFSTMVICPVLRTYRPALCGDSSGGPSLTTWSVGRSLSRHHTQLKSRTGRTGKKLVCPQQLRDRQSSGWTSSESQPEQDRAAQSNEHLCDHARATISAGSWLKLGKQGEANEPRCECYITNRRLGDLLFVFGVWLLSIFIPTDSQKPKNGF